MIIQVIVKLGKIQDADMDAFPELVIGISLLQLPGKHNSSADEAFAPFFFNVRLIFAVLSLL